MNWACRLIKKKKVQAGSLQDPSSGSKGQLMAIAMDTGKSVLSKDITQCCEDLHIETIRLHQIKESDVKTLLDKKCHNVCKNSSILCEAKAIYIYIYMNFVQ